MLKGIPAILSPELLKVLAEMGHGDDLVIGDINFPAESMGKRCVRADGHGGVELLDAILQLFPLDVFVAKPVSLMKTLDGTVPPIWEEFGTVVGKHQKGVEPEYLDREEFYERSQKAYAIVATSENALYACVIIKKGINI